MCKGKRFRSGRGASKSEASQQYNDWFAKTFSADLEEIKEVEKIALADQATQDTLSQFGLSWSESPETAKELFQAAIAKPTTRPADSMATAVKDYLAWQLTQGVSQKRVVVETSQLEFLKEHFPNCTINRASWKVFVIELLKRNRDNENNTGGCWSARYTKDCRNTYWHFLRWGNLEQRIQSDDFFYLLSKDNIKVQVHNPQVEYFEKEEIQELLSRCNQDLRIMFLLMLNTGSTQEDLSQFTMENVDLKSGTLTRLRTKHKKHPNAPTVQYTLWPELLKWFKTKKDHQGLIFTRTSGRAIGKPLVTGRDDWLAGEYDKLRGTQTKTLKHFRKTGATWISSSPWKAYRDMYLANSGGGIGDRHYDGSVIFPKEATEHVRKKAGL